MNAAAMALNSKKKAPRPVVMNTAVNNLFDKIMDEPVIVNEEKEPTPLPVKSTTDN